MGTHPKPHYARPQQEKEMQNNKKGGERVHLKQVCFCLSDQAKNFKMTITSLISLVKNLGNGGKNQGTHKTIMIGIMTRYHSSIPNSLSFLTCLFVSS